MAKDFRDTITIKFKPEDDQKLIRAINSLDKATKSLLNSQAKLVDKERKGETTREKNKKQIASLIIKVKALGGEWSKNSKLLGLHKKALKGNKIAMQQLRNESSKYIVKLKQTKKGISDTTKGLFGLGHSARQTGGAFSVLRSKLLLINFAMALGVRQLIKFGSEASKLQSMEKAFNTLSGGIGKSSIALKKLQNATDGTMSNFDLFQQANNAMILGVTKNSDEMAEMFDMAQRLGEALGKDTKESVESLITGMGRQSRLMLDNIGIIVDSEKAYKTYAKSMKVSVDSLSDVDRKQAFLNATILSARQKLLGLNKEQTNASMALQTMRASMKNASAEIGEGILPILVALAKATTILSNSLDATKIKQYGTGLASVGATALILSINIKKAKDQIMAMQALSTRSWVMALVAILGVAAGALLDYAGAFGEVNKQAEHHQKVLEHLARKYNITVKEVKTRIEQEEKLNQITKESRETQEESAKSLRQKLDLLYATSEEEKMRIMLGHEASALELQLISQIVEKTKKLKEEELALKEFAKSQREWADAQKLEMETREQQYASLRSVEIEYYSEWLNNLELQGKATESNAKKMRLFLDFQTLLYNKFGDRIKIEGKLKGLSIDHADVIEKLNINQSELNSLEQEFVKWAKDVYDLKLANINLDKEELSLREQLIGKLSEYQEKTIEMQSIESERANLILGQISQVTSAWKTMYQTKMRNEIDTLKQTSAYRNADSERRMDMEEKITRKYANNAKAMFYVEKASKLADVYFNTASAQMKSVALFPATGGQPWYSIIGAMGLAQAGAVMATPAPQAFAKGGDFVTNKPELIMVGEAGREHVKITPVDRPESRALKDGGITINISAPLVDETVIDTIIPAIQKAQRMNLA